MSIRVRSCCLSILYLSPIKLDIAKLILHAIDHLINFLKKVEKWSTQEYLDTVNPKLISSIKVNLNLVKGFSPFFFLSIVLKSFW